MSLDNGNFIVKLKKVDYETIDKAHDYYVFHAHAMGNINGTILYDILIDTNAPKHESRKAAVEDAQCREDQYRTEHGVLLITDFEDNTLIDLERFKTEKQNGLRNIYSTELRFL